MKKIIIFTMLIGAILAGCPSPTNQDYVAPHPTPVVTDSDQCVAAEANLKNKHCIPDDEPYTKKGKSFTQFCKDKQEQGIFLNPKCLANVTTCDQVDVCTGTK